MKIISLPNPLTKYPYMKGAQCKKSLWLNYHSPNLKALPTLEEKLHFENGRKVGLLARKLHPNGIDISENGRYSGMELVNRTKLALEGTGTVFYEAAFITPGNKMMSVADILIRGEKRIVVIEVKSATKIKLPEYVDDVSFQYRVFNDCGFDMKKFEIHLAFLNRDYCLDGDELDLDDLFLEENMTFRAIENQVLLNRRLYELQPSISDSKCPSHRIGAHCSQPHPCAFKNHCWQNVPEQNIFTISRIKKRKAEKLLSNGIIDLNDIDERVELTELQRIQVDAYKSNSPNINIKKIKSFLDSLNWEAPMFFLDFETMRPAIPRFHGTSPYQQICVQYCLLKRDSPKSTLQRREFIGDFSIDPRRDFIEQLLDETEDIGDIIVYNETFEKGRLLELADCFPEYASDIRNRVSRLKDLEIPFAKKDYYHPMMKGSASIKNVLSSVVPDMVDAYKKLPINNGAIAMFKYEGLSEMEFVERQKTIQELLEYCYTDSYSMVRVVDALKSLTEKK